MNSLGTDSLIEPWKQTSSEERSGDGSTTVDSTIVEVRQGPGVLLLSTDTRLVYLNRRGAELMKFVTDLEASKARGSLPRVIIQICGEIHKLLQSEVSSKDFEQLEVRRIAGDALHPVLLRGFGLPGRKPHAARVLIILEAIARRDHAAGQAKERFQLTTREQSVVEHLARGWTNKEIGSALGITEPTVKCHIKHIMEKTKVTTRTGILVEILQA